MIYLTLAAFALLLAHIVATAEIIKSLIRQQARERDLLVNQIMHLSGRTWSPPPVDVPEPEPLDEIERFVTAPDQLPDF